jgi:hypothetical protein
MDLLSVTCLFSIHSLHCSIAASVFSLITKGKGCANRKVAKLYKFQGVFFGVFNFKTDMARKSIIVRQAKLPPQDNSLFYF